MGGAIVHRGRSLISTIVFTRDVILDYVCKNELLSDSQHGGFTAKRSRLTNLLAFIEDLADHIDKVLHKRFYGIWKL